MRINNFNWKHFNYLVIGLTLLKILAIYFFYQHIVYVENGIPKIIPSYTWDQLVESLHEGKYRCYPQISLSGHFDFQYQAYRPPIYALLLYVFTFTGSFAPFVSVFIQSVITSLIAYVGYLLVKNEKQNSHLLAGICFLLLFFFPMNFLKSGSIDEAPLMVLFELVSIYSLFLWRKNEKVWLLLVAGLFLGLAILTRFTIVLLVPLFAGYILVVGKRKIFSVFILSVSLFLTLSPWLYRNYMVFNQPVLSTGSHRLFLYTQSNEFIENFPEKSIDEIEYNYFINHYDQLKYLNSLDELEREKEFKRRAVQEMVNNPSKFFRSFLVKVKVLLPFKYFPERENLLRDLVYGIPYALSILIMIFSLFFFRVVSYNSLFLLLANLLYLSTILIFFMLSRHLYPVIIWFFINAFYIFTNEERRYKKSSVS